MAYQGRDESEPQVSPSFYQPQPPTDNQSREPEPQGQYQQGFQSYQPPPPQQQQPYQPQYQSYQPMGSYSLNQQQPPPPEKPPTVGPLESDEEKKQHMIVRILRILFIAFQMAALTAGMALVIVGSLWYRQVRKQSLHMTFFGSIPMYAIGAGVALALLSCIGLVSAITRGRSGAVVYALLMASLMACQAYMLFRTTRLDKQVMHFLSSSWEGMSDKQRGRVQRWRKCCGFANGDDRAVEPCPAGAVQGCAVPVHAVVKKWAGGVVKGLAVSVAVEVVLIALALVISFSSAKY